MNTSVQEMYPHHKKVQQQHYVTECFGAGTLPSPPPPDHARRRQQGRDQQIDHDEGG